jgi:hypothetical protein
VEFTESGVGGGFRANQRSLAHSTLMTSVVVVGFVSAFVLIIFAAALLFVVALFMIQGA